MDLSLQDSGCFFMRAVLLNSLATVCGWQAIYVFVHYIHSHVYIKTHGRVTVAKKAVWRTSVLFTGTANLPFSAPRISITTGPISIKFTYFMPSIYAALHTKFERNRSSSSRDTCSWKLPYFFTFFFFFFAPFYKSNYEPSKNTLPVNRFLSNVAYL